MDTPTHNRDQHHRVAWTTARYFNTQSVTPLIGNTTFISQPESFQPADVSLTPFVTELLQKVYLMQAQVSALEGQLAKQRLDSQKLMALKNLNSKKLALKEAVFVTAEYKAEDDVHVVSSADLNLWGYGDTEQLAVKDFCSELETFYFDLKEEKNNLGKDFQTKWDYLKTIVKEIKKNENAAQAQRVWLHDGQI